MKSNINDIISFSYFIKMINYNGCIIFICTMYFWVFSLSAFSFEQHQFLISTILFFFWLNLISTILIAFWSAFCFLLCFCCATPASFTTLKWEPLAPSVQWHFYCSWLTVISIDSMKLLHSQPWQSWTVSI